MDATVEAELLGGVPLPALILGADERVLALNPAAQAVLG